MIDVEQQPDGIWLYPGRLTSHPGEKNSPLDPVGIPIWGMGLGAQLLAQAYGAELAPMEVGHFGEHTWREIATGKNRR